MTWGPVARIVVRYGAGALVALGIFGAVSEKQIASDPDLIWLAEILIGLVASGATEAWYYLARKFGWQT